MQGCDGCNPLEGSYIYNGYVLKCTLLKLEYAMHTQWYVIHTILLHTNGVFRFGMKYTPLYAHYLMALAPPI